MKAFLVGLRNVLVGLAAFSAAMVGLAWIGTKLFGDDGVIVPFLILAGLAIWFLWFLMTDPDTRPGDEEAAASVLPLDQAELAAPVFLVDSENQPLLNQTGPGPLEIPRIRWVIVAVLLGLALWPWLVWVLRGRPEDNSLVLLILSFFTIPVLLFWIPSLARTTRHRHQLLRRGLVVKGVLQCLSAKFAIAGGDDLPEYKLTLGYAFYAPDGQLLKGILRRSAMRNHHPLTYSEKLGQNEFEGYDDGEYDYSRWPKPGGRVPVAIVYVRPQLFRIL